MSLPSFNYYNADLLELSTALQALGYVDDTMIMAIGEDYEETTQAIREHMEGENGGFRWSADHNSKFDINKVAIMHLGHKKRRSSTGTPRPTRTTTVRGKDNETTRDKGTTGRR